MYRYILYSVQFLTFVSEIPFSICNTHDNLVAVVQIFRHGQRTPIECYPNDPYLNDWNRLGYGQLTKEGKRQLYVLGEFTRRRYQNWLPEQYDSNHFIARTTNVTRNILSTIFNLKGLYPEEKGRQHIPLHLEDPNVLKSLLPFTCTNYYIETANYLTRRETLAVEERFRDVYKYFSDNAGKNITNFPEVDLPSDCLEVESDLGLSLPIWAKHIFPIPLTELHGYSFDALTHTTRQQRLFMGSWFNEVLRYLEGMVKNPSASQKFQLYCAHDYNIAGILNTFDAYRPPFPITFATSIYIELRKNSQYHYVNIWFKDNNELRKIRIRGCDFDCPLADVVEVLQEIVLDVQAKNTECHDESIKLESDSAKEMYDKLEILYA